MSKSIIYDFTAIRAAMPKDKPICPVCEHEIDPDWCHCGDRIDLHTWMTGHTPVPAGCVCGYDTE